MAAHLIWSERARSDLRDIVTYIAAESPVTAAAVSHRIIDRVRSLPDQPGQGRRLSDHQGADDLREIIVQSWRIIYRAADAEVMIIAIVHSARLLRNVPPL